MTTDMMNLLDGMDLFGTGLSISKQEKGQAFNRIASQYMEKNMGKIISIIHSKGIGQAAEDLFMDLFESIYRKEESGQAFSSEYFGTDNELKVEQYIFSMVNKYCENEKYKNDGVRIKSAGNETFCEVSATMLDERAETVSEFQLAFKNASYEDEFVQEIEEDIVDSIEVMVDIASIRGFNVKEMLRSIGEMIEISKEYGYKELKNYKNNMLGQVRQLAEEHSDFKVSLVNLMSHINDNLDVVEKVVANMG